MSAILRILQHPRKGTTVLNHIRNVGQTIEAPSMVADVLDDMERIHLQLHLLEYRSREGCCSASALGDRLSELADEVKSVMERLS